MSLQTIQESIPSYAKDIKLNLSSLLNNENPLTKQQFWGTMLASAVANKNKELLFAVQTQAEEYLSPEAISAAKSAATLMAMNNVYYRFIHSASNPEYAKMPANLRMSVMAQPGIDKNDFELFSLAVSAINGCGYCMDSHEKLLLAKGISKEVIQTSARIAAILSAVAVILETL
jgi:alkyl hydroperoxide reductase subunit D